MCHLQKRHQTGCSVFFSCILDLLLLVFIFCHYEILMTHFNDFAEPDATHWNTHISKGCYILKALYSHSPFTLPPDPKHRSLLHTVNPTTQMHHENMEHFSVADKG